MLDHALRLAIATSVLATMLAFPASAEPLTIVSWNVSPDSAETFEERLSDLEKLNADLAPDVLILVETTGSDGAQRIAEALGWERYFGVASDFSSHATNAFFALETAVISKVPIERVVEYDASPDGVQAAFSNEDGFTAPIEEAELSSSGIGGFTETVARTDRGTLRVDLDGGLTVFPLHLKSNRNGACIELSNAGRALRAADIEVPAALEDALAAGFSRATREHLRNAQKRERVMAATIRVAEDAIAEGRTVLIAGDYNTAFEPGKTGSDFTVDCALKDFSCDRAPFPALACAGDGFDDTLAMLEDALIGPTRWSVLSKHLPRTFDDDAFADLAIDHIAVPAQDADRFAPAERADNTYGSDHFPIFTVYSD